MDWMADDRRTGGGEGLDPDDILATASDDEEGWSLSRNGAGEGNGQPLTFKPSNFYSGVSKMVSRKRCYTSRTLTICLRGEPEERENQPKERKSREKTKVPASGRKSVKRNNNRKVKFFGTKDEEQQSNKMQKVETKTAQKSRAKPAASTPHPAVPVVELKDKPRLVEALPKDPLIAREPPKTPNSCDTGYNSETIASPDLFSSPLKSSPTQMKRKFFKSRTATVREKPIFIMTYSKKCTPKLTTPASQKRALFPKSVTKNRESVKPERKELRSEESPIISLDNLNIADNDSDSSMFSFTPKRARLDDGEQQDDREFILEEKRLAATSSASSSASKLFPIFETNSANKGRFEPLKSKSTSGTGLRSSSGKSRRKLPFIKSEDQYAIDAGQRDFDASRCKVCHMIYTMGEISDEKHHFDFHNNYVNGLKFSSWAKERVVKYYDDGSRVVAVLPHDTGFKHKKIDQLFSLADNDLGIRVSLKESMKPSSMFLILISAEKRVSGFVAAEQIKEASRVIGDEMTCVSTESEPAEIGVARLWVQANHRRQGVASKLLDVLRANFFPDKIVSREALAFSDPTVEGKEFAKQFTGTDHFLVFQYQVPDIGHRT